MDKDFWASIANNDYRIPDGYQLEDLTGTLFGYLGSTNPEMRDEIAYIVYANWLKRELYTRDQVHAHVNELLANLEKGIGATDSDSVFLRTFSVLFLAEIVHNDNKKPLLEKGQVESILAKGLWYLDAEKDPRGHIPVKGWAHSLAHTADLMMVLGKNRHLGENELARILKSIANKIMQTNNYVYIHREDERLANAIIEIFRCDLLDSSVIDNWAENFLQADRFTNEGAYREETSRVYQNTRNLLRSVHLQILGQDEFPQKEKLQLLLLKVLQSLQQF